MPPQKRQKRAAALKAKSPDRVAKGTRTASRKAMAASRKAAFRRETSFRPAQRSGPNTDYPPRPGRNNWPMRWPLSCPHTILQFCRYLDFASMLLAAAVSRAWANAVSSTPRWRSNVTRPSTQHQQQNISQKSVQAIDC